MGRDAESFLKYYSLRIIVWRNQFGDIRSGVAREVPVLMPYSTNFLPSKEPYLLTACGSKTKQTRNNFRIQNIEKTHSESTTWCFLKVY